ncbi:hypothetical protein S40288_11696 [Stachybotrys chartarum IBT 40288]|nr:hypothetical protein S40288_11696 [Stachybotrys chartarum IBT 40288]
MREVARRFNTSYTIVRRIKQRWLNDHTLDYSPRKGHPEKLTAQEKRYIIRMAKKDRQISYNALYNTTSQNVSHRTIQRIVRKYYDRKWKALKRPKLTKESARIRLRFAQGWIKDIHELKEAIFSNEASLKNHSDNPSIWVFHKAHEKYHPDLVNLTDHIKPTISLIFWAGIWKEGHMSIILMEYDPDAPRGGYSAKSYQDILQEGLLPIYDGTQRFQQDNSSLHNAGETQDWLQ